MKLTKLKSKIVLNGEQCYEYVNLEQVREVDIIEDGYRLIIGDRVALDIADDDPVITALIESANSV